MFLLDIYFINQKGAYRIYLVAHVRMSRDILQWQIEDKPLSGLKDKSPATIYTDVGYVVSIAPWQELARSIIKVRLLYLFCLLQTDASYRGFLTKTFLLNQ